MQNTEQQEKYLRAKDRVAELKKFYTGLGSYVFVIGLLAAINYYTNEWRSMWFLWVAFFWGIGIVAQIFKIFGMNLLLGRNWEDKKIKEMMESENNDPRSNNRWE